MTLHDFNLLIDLTIAGYALLLIFDKKQFKANWFIISILLINAIMGLIAV